MPFRRLRYFVAVAEHRNFGRAAQAIGVAQSALSRHVLDLERTVGAPLLERTAAGTRLTPVGREFYADAVRVLAQLDATFEHARRVASGQSGRLRIGLNDLAGRFAPVAAAIASFAAQHPDIFLDLRSMTSHAQLAELRSRQIDGGFMIERSVEAIPFDHLHIARDRFVLAVRAGGELAAAPSVSSSMLADIPFVGLSMKQHWLAQSRLLSHCRAIGFQPNMVIEVESDRLQLSLVAAGVGLALVNESAAHALPARVVLVPISDLDAALDLDFTWRTDEVSPLVEDFVRLLRAQLLPQAGAVSLT